MDGGKTGVVVVGLLFAVLSCFGGAFFSLAGILAMDAVESREAIPPELEAVYRQVGLRTGVPWAALAAWDGAGNQFTIPAVPTVDEIFAEKVTAELDARRESDEQWCHEHPEDTENCPPDEPELNADEELLIWKSAYAAWMRLLRAYVERRASDLLPYLSEFVQSPETTYGRFLQPMVAIRATEFFEGYQVLDGLEADADEILVAPVVPPVDWVPVDGFAWPVVAPLTSRFGLRVSPIDGQLRLHAGIDLGAATGTPIRASRAGRVVEAGFSQTYGWMVVIDHGDDYRSLYAHSSSLAVSMGQVVNQGDVVSHVGSTGRSTGPHLHFEIYYLGTPIDPLLLLTQRVERS